MKKNMITPYDAFKAALSHLLKEIKGITQKKLAKNIGVSPQYLSAVIAGRKRFSLLKQDEIAKFFKLDYDDFLGYGKSILKGAEKFPWKSELDKYKKNSPERASLIFKRAAENFGIKGFTFFDATPIGGSREPVIVDYLNGKIDEDELYKSAKLLILRLKSQLE